MLLLPFTLLCLLSPLLSKDVDVKLFLIDFIKQFKIPSKIYTYTCWNRGESREFLLLTFKNSLLVSTLNPLKDGLIRSFPEEHGFYIVDTDCKGFQNIFLQAEEYKMLKRQFRWLILGNSSEYFLDSIVYNIDSKIFIASKVNDGFSVKAVYKLSAASSIQKQDVAKWCPLKGFSYFNQLSTRNRTNLQKLAMNFSYVLINRDSTKHLWDYRDRHIDSLTKVSYTQVHYIKKMLNITSFEICHDTWGYKDPKTNTINGMIGDILHDISVMGVTPGFITMERFQVLDFIDPPVRTNVKFIFREPPLPYITNIYTLPFDTHSWYACFLMLFLVLFTMFAISKWEWKNIFLKKNNKQGGLGSLRPEITDVSLFEVGAITQQGADVEPKSVAGRTAALFTLVALFFLHTAYSANIVALLQSTSDNIRTVEDLLTSRIKLGAEDIVYSKYFFALSNSDPIRQKIYNTKLAPKGDKTNFITAEEGVKRIKEEFYAFHTEPTKAYKIILDTFQESEKCGLREIEYFKLFEPHTMAKKNSSYTEFFKIGFQRIREVGIMNREMKKIYIAKPPCNSKGNNFQSISFSDCRAAFEVFGVGVALSISICFAELIIRKSFYKLKI